MIKTFRIKNKKTGEYFQRSGHFGKVPRNYTCIGHVRTSALEHVCLNPKYNDLDDLIIEEVVTEVAQEMSFQKFYDESALLREQRKAKEEESRKKWRKKQLEEELSKL